MKKSALQDEDKFMVRFPDGVRQMLADAAKENGRSLNAEIVRRLLASLAVPEDVVAACGELAPVTDRLDFAVRLFQRAGMNVSIPDETAD